MDRQTRHHLIPHHQLVHYNRRKTNYHLRNSFSFSSHNMHGFYHFCFFFMWYLFFFFHTNQQDEEDLDWKTIAMIQNKELKRIYLIRWRLSNFKVTPEIHNFIFNCFLKSKNDGWTKWFLVQTPLICNGLIGTLKTGLLFSIFGHQYNLFYILFSIVNKHG
jgi:hypothetical protein